MGRRKRIKPLYENVHIVDIASDGRAVGKTDETVIFTKGAVPGDVVDLQVFKKRKKYSEAFITKYHTYSEDRIDAFCEHFGTCGGCKWQFMGYEKQLEYKHTQVENQLQRIGHVKLPEFERILGSKKTDFYRNKLEYTFSNKRWLTVEEIEEADSIQDRDALGFHIPGCFDKILDIDKCWLQCDPSNGIRNSVKEFAIKNNYEFFDIREQVGFLRNIIIRTPETTGEIMVILSFFKEDVEKREAILNMLAEKFPEITSLMYVINQKANDTITDQDIICYKGRDHVFEEMEGLSFKIGPKSFYQTNSEQAYELYKITRDFAELTGDELVYDLYTGTGTIAQFVSKRAKKVIGVEYVPEAIEDAKVNAENNKITNTDFFAGDMKDVLNDAFIRKHGQPDVIITDPPRAGMHDDVIKTILRAAPKRIVYVSCNPATQARDLGLLDEDYEVTRVRPVDMFPHTHHVENVVALTRRSK